MHASRFAVSAALSAVLFLPSCAGVSTPAPDAAPVPAQDLPWAAPALERSIAVFDGHSGDPLELDALLDRLAEADVVFLGETHIDETTHRVEQAVLAGLLARKQGRVVLSMEMFERDVQEHLDAYLAGEIDEPTFLSKSRPWGNYRTGYRPLVETARAAGAPVVAANFPSPLRRPFAMKKAEALETLDEQQLSWVPDAYYPNTPEYWRRVDNAIRGHAAFMRQAGGDDDRTFATQSLWDNSMGEACAKALDRHPGHLVLHVNGGFHTMYWDGTAHQLKLRKPEARVATVSILPSSNPSVANVGGKPWADYVVFAESRASDQNEGTWSVAVQRSVEYRFHLPEGASAESPVPLLIWLGDDGLTSKDGMNLWKSRLGDDVAIAVLDAPHRETQADLGEGGRWFWADTFSEDVGTGHTAIARAWGYLLRNFPIDPARVCLAGEGTGATVVAATSLRADGIDHRAVALTPRRFAKIKDFPLPLPEYRGDAAPPDKALKVIVKPGDLEWWAGEVAEYEPIGFSCRLATVDDDAWSVEIDAENAVREALGFDPRPTPDAGVGAKRFVTVASDSPRARHWARLLALAASKEDGSPVAVLETAPEGAGDRQIVTEVTPERMTKPGALPPCPGPFGGTTVVVLPAGTPEDVVQAWVAFETKDPLSARNRFLRTRIATADGERSLPKVLEKLLAKNRKNVLIVPASFCADGGTMRTLEKQARPFSDQMTLTWMPGFGSRAAAWR